MGLFITHPINLQQIQQATRSPQKNLIQGHNRGKKLKNNREREREKWTQTEREIF